jgi:LPXTG-motif cell wall-anchored protein
MAIGVVLFGIAIAPGVASAHHPLVSGTTQCRVDSWSVTWTARADETRGLTWRITSPSGYAPSGFQADSAAFTRTATYPGTQTSATETVGAQWSNGSTGSSSGTVQRPPLCPTTTTTTTTTTAPPTTTTTTTAPTTTTTPGETTTTLAGETSTTIAGPTTTVEQAGPTTSSVGQQGPTSSVDQSSGAATTVGGSLPATGTGDDTAALVVLALTLIGIGAVMLRLTSKPTG